MYSRTFSRRLGSAALLLVCAATMPAFAQTDEQRAGARSLATEGASAFNDGRFKDAVDLFSKAESLVHAPPHLLFIARASTKLGQYVKAREAYLKITKEQLPPNAPQAFRDAQGSASREMAAIDHKIGGLIIKVEGAGEAKDLQIKLDGNPIPSVLVGVSQPVDPGDHRVEAVAAGYRAQPKSIKVGEAERATVTVKLEVDPNAAPTPVPGPAGGAKPGEPAPAPAPGGAQMGGGASGGGVAPPPAPDAPTSGGSSGTKIAAFSAFGVGAVGIGLGTVFILKSSAKRSQADDICKTGVGGCPPDRKNDILQLDSDASSAQTIAIVGFAVGGASIVTGVLLLALGGGSSSGGGPKAAASNTTGAKSAASADPHVEPWVGLGMAGISGRF
jgi:hypothetical protein